MGISERKEREKIERKNLIMDCAKALILERGVENVSMTDIAEKAELSKATLYLYFHSKDELFREICYAAGSKFLTLFRSRLEPFGGFPGRGSALDILKLFWNTYLVLFGESHDMIIIFSLKHYLVPGYPVLFPEGQDDPMIVNEIFTTLENLLTRGIDEGFFDPETNIAAVSQAILSLFSNIIENAAKLPNGERDLNTMLEELRKLFQIILKGIARQGLDPALLELPANPEPAA